MECVKCGHQNPDGQGNCAVCGLVLATIEQTEGGAVHPVYDRYVAIRKACEAAGGGGPMDAFKRFLDETSFKMAQKEQEIREIDIPPDAMDGLREELEVGFEGIDLYNQSLIQFRQFSTTSDPNFLRNGLELAWQGNERINEARRINRRNRALMEAEEPAGTEG
ncbi:MAG: hypothetical protein FJX76_14895 [Armatimonadetes bacterium]|nr:hypothetical protein [Armatimonadota bacterium]